jgi:hypothetical protein
MLTVIARLHHDAADVAYVVVEGARGATFVISGLLECKTCSEGDLESAAVSAGVELMSCPDLGCDVRTQVATDLATSSFRLRIG